MVSFASAFVSTRHDGCGRWLWRLVGLLCAKAHCGSAKLTPRLQMAPGCPLMLLPLHRSADLAVGITLGNERFLRGRAQPRAGTRVQRCALPKPQTKSPLREPSACAVGRE